MLKILRFHIFFPWLILSSLYAEDSYHTYIRAQLSAQYGVSGGVWMLSDNEKQTNTNLHFANISHSIQPSSGIETFNQIVEMYVPERRSNSWDNILQIVTTAPIQQNDVLLLVLWMENTDSLSFSHEVIFDFDLMETPFAKPLYLSGKIKPGWRQWFLPFQVAHNVPAGQARFQIHFGNMAGECRLAGLALLNLAQNYSLAQLPQSTFHLEYDGQEKDAVWRELALQRIENIRMETFTIRVLNRHNEPIEGADVFVNMRRHAFGFGAAVSSEPFFQENHNARIYRQKLENLAGDGRSFNIVTLQNELKWPAWEDENVWGTRDKVRDMIQWFVDRHIKVRGHNLLWPNWDYMPADLKAKSYDRSYLIARIKNHILEQVGFAGLLGHIAEWDVLNEIQQNRDICNTLGSENIYSDCFKWATLADSSARLYINENEILTEGDSKEQMLDSFKRTIQDIVLANAPLHGIGIQGHMKNPLMSPESLINFFNEFNDLGLDLSITEYDAAGVNEHIAADYMRDLLIAVFSHPRLCNFVMWGFWDGAHWRGDSPIFRTDWSLKFSGQVFIDLVFDRWWTTENGKTDSQGNFITRAFLGDYDVSASLFGRMVEATFSLSKQEKTLVLKLDTDQTMSQSPETFSLEQNHPNPFNQFTTASYFLPQRMSVTIEIFDLLGRKVDILVNQEQEAGRHWIKIDGSNLASGIYYLHMHSGSLRRVAKLALVK